MNKQTNVNIFKGKYRSFRSSKALYLPLSPLTAMALTKKMTNKVVV